MRQRKCAGQHSASKPVDLNKSLVATFDQTQLAATTTFQQRNATHSSEASDNFPKHT
eukprot:COSAG06_NODE_46265_length_348_cov_0.767068_2_plen_56_part_01